MKRLRFHSQYRGSSLIEAVIAMAVLAVAIPLVFAALAESGKSGISAAAETRSTWIIPACLSEIRASRAGLPQFFSATSVGEEFPSSDVWAIAFSPEGRPLGKVPKALYDTGVQELDGQRIGYIAALSATTPVPAPSGPVPMLRARISLEYPPAAPAAKRQKLDFFTRIP